MSDTRPSEHQDKPLKLDEMRRRGFFDDVPTGDDFFSKSIDHRAEAESWAPAGIEPITTTYRDDSEIVAARGLEIAHAQVHATLYLAEQQRIANLIAWQALTSESNRVEIRKGLGL